jgi:protein CpxP
MAYRLSKSFLSLSGLATYKEVTKTMTTRLCLLVFGFGAALLVSGAASAQPPRFAPQGGMMRRLVRHLALTDAQRAEIRSIVRQTADANAALRDQLHSLRQQERDAIRAGKSEAELRTLAESAAPIMAQLHANRLATRAKIYALLTPEQKQKADQFREHARPRSGRRMQRFPSI